jgi:putative ABC transport system permease protein
VLAPVGAELFRAAGVTPAFFEVLGVRPMLGRTPGPTDARALAKRFGAIDDALGRKLTIWRSEKFTRQIVGIVENAIGASRETPIPPTIYLPYPQAPVPSLTLLIRTEINPTNLVEAVRRTVRPVDPNLPLYQIFTMDQRLARSISERLFLSALLTVFAVIAFTLAMAGIYGLTRYAARNHCSSMVIE